MSAQVFDGKKFVSERENHLKERVEKLNFTPRIVSIYFAEDLGSVQYTNLKQVAAGRVGIEFHAEKVSIKDDTISINRLIESFVKDQGVHGVMIQKPAKSVFYDQPDAGWAGPGMMQTVVKNLRYFVKSQGAGKGTDKWWRRLTSEISPHKDVDCLTTVNLDRVYRGRWKIVPATVRAVLSIIELSLNQPLTRQSLVNRRAVVVGRSEIVGKPLAHVLAQKGADVVLCASTGVVARSQGSRLIDSGKPQELREATRAADILISATGKQGLVSGEMVKKGAAVIDVGAPHGDVDFDSVKKKASFITPVPGGVGPVTVVSLLENLLDLV